MSNYFIAKLSALNYRMAIHEGNANRRLASEAINIYLLSPTEVPLQYQKSFNKLRKLIEETIKNLPAPGLTPTKLLRIRNRTAAEFIKLLLTVEHSLTD
ncbi:MAG TPA: hypothetical protein VN958_14850 [Chitinophagaceae bacterium]|nr:hypothetical protein [Chitinophagaceae bacterium]